MKHIYTRLSIFVLLFNVLAMAPKAEAQPVSKYPCAKYHADLRRHGLPVKVFAPIMWRESKCQPRAVGWNYHKGMSHRDCKLTPAETYRKCKAVRSYDVGLLQINSSWKTLTAQVCKTKFGKMFVLRDVECNLKVASVLYADGKGLVNWRGTSGLK
jgi:hypothetical protein